MVSKTKGPGRPIAISEAMEEVILERLASLPVETVFSDPDLPTKQTFYNHCKRSPTFFDASARARAFRALVDLDDAEADLHTATPDNISVVRERMQHARWKVSRMLRQYYGEKVGHELSGPDGGPIRTEATVDTSKLSTETLRAVLRDLDSADPAES